MIDGPIPARPLPTSARAPGKCILFGEHAVVHGKPELLLALDLSTQVTVRPAPTFSLNGSPLGGVRNPYLAPALDRLWSGRPPVAIVSVSHVPRSAGLGSSAAFVTALSAALAAASGGVERPRLAQIAFDVERGAQGVGSPGDTSAVVAGGYTGVNLPGAEPRWTVVDGERTWKVGRWPDPGWVWVVADTGVARSTAAAVRAVSRRLAEPDGPALLERFERVVQAGAEAVRAEDRAGVGHALDENQSLLRAVGVSHPRIEALLEAARPEIEGGKLTGAGAGGSVVVLPKPGRESAALRRLSSAGGRAFAVRPSARGADLLAAFENAAPPRASED